MYLRVRTAFIPPPMLRIIPFLLFYLSLLARATDITGQVHWNDICRNGTDLGYAKAFLDEGSLYGSIKADGKFTIPGVPDGTYILSFNAHDYSFDQLRVDVNHTSMSPVEVRPYISGTPMNPPSFVILPYPVLVSPKEKYNYFIPRERFNVGGMLSNPLMLVTIFCGVLVVATPRIMKKLDPETLEEFNREHAKMLNAGRRELPQESSKFGPPPSTLKSSDVEVPPLLRKITAAHGLKTSKMSSKKAKR